MKDITATTFGLLIAFVLPGLVFLYGLTYWSPRAAQAFRGFLTAESTTGLFFLVVLASLAAGLTLTTFRWVLFERLLCQKHRFDPKEFAALNEESVLLAFNAAVDAHFRYHQFWGGMVFALPVLYWGGLINSNGLKSDCIWIVAWICFVVLEVITIFAAREAYLR